MNPHPTIPIVIDTREQQPLDFADLNCTTARGTVPVFDYALAGDEANFAVERKAVGDFVNSITTTEGQRHEQAKCRRARDVWPNMPIVYVIEGGIYDLLPARACPCVHPRPSERCPKCKVFGNFCDCIEPRPALGCQWCHGTGTIGYNYEGREIHSPFVYHQVSVMLYEWRVVPLFAGTRLMAACMIEAILRRRYEWLELKRKANK